MIRTCVCMILVHEDRAISQLVDHTRRRLPFFYVLYKFRQIFPVRCHHNLFLGLFAHRAVVVLVANPQTQQALFAGRLVPTCPERHHPHWLAAQEARGECLVVPVIVVGSRDARGGPALRTRVARGPPMRARRLRMPSAPRKLLFPLAVVCFVDSSRWLASAPLRLLWAMPPLC